MAPCATKEVICFLGPASKNCVLCGVWYKEWKRWQTWKPKEDGNKEQAAKEATIDGNKEQAAKKATSDGNSASSTDWLQVDDAADAKELEGCLHSWRPPLAAQF